MTLSIPEPAEIQRTLLSAREFLKRSVEIFFSVVETMRGVLEVEMERRGCMKTGVKGGEGGRRDKRSGKGV